MTIISTTVGQRSNCQDPLDHQKSKRVPEKHLFLIFPVLTKDMYYFISFPPKDDCICLRGALQARRQQYVNCELPDVQAGFRKGRGTRDQIANICWIIKKAREFQRKTSTSALLTMPKPLTVWITINCGKF